MSEKPKDIAADEGFNDPDLQNSEQNEAGTQAQDIAEEALTLTDDDDALESTAAPQSNPADIVPRDVPDLVDNIKNMLHSGQIDMGAYEGEEGMDDEDE